MYECLVKGSLNASAFTDRIPTIVSCIGGCRDIALITSLQKILLLLCERSQQPNSLPLQTIPVCMNVMTLLVGKGAWSGLTGCITITHHAFLSREGFSTA